MGGRSLILVSALLVVGGVSCGPGPTIGGEPVTLEWRLADTVPSPGLQPVLLAHTGEAVYLHPESIVTRADVDRMEASRTADGVLLTLHFSAAGAVRMAEVTGSHPGRRLAMLVDGRPLIAPRIVARIDASSVPVHAAIPLDSAEARQLIERLNDSP